MEEIFVVQKRSTADGQRTEFYFRIVDTRTGEQLFHSYLDQQRAEVQCQRLNTLAARHFDIASEKYIDADVANQLKVGL